MGRQSDRRPPTIEVSACTDDDGDCATCSARWWFWRRWPAGLATSADAGTSPVGGKYSSYAYLAVSRSGPAVYVNALIHQDSATGTAASPNRTVYLQRQLSGHWQNVLARNTDAHGRFTVGYLSAPSFSYRLVAPASGNAWGATSGDGDQPAAGRRVAPGPVAGGSVPPCTDSLRSPSGQFRLTVEP